MNKLDKLTFKRVIFILRRDILNYTCLNPWYTQSQNIKMAQRKVVWRMASSIPGSQEFIRNVVGKNGSKNRFLQFCRISVSILYTICDVNVRLNLLLYNISNGNKMDIHFCSIDQSWTGYFLSEFPNQHCNIIDYFLIDLFVLSTFKMEKHCCLSLKFIQLSKSMLRFTLDNVSLR